MKTKQKDMPWGTFCGYLIGLYLLLYAFFYVIDKIYKPALAYDQKIEAQKKLEARK